MKRSITVVLAALILLIMISQAQAGPEMYIPEKSFNFGYVPQNSKVSHVFWLHSVGDDTLKIISVKPG